MTKLQTEKLTINGTNEVRTVGELREILSHFSDDVPMGNNYQWHHVQVREVDSKVCISVGKVQTWGK